jgi:hypothetical protein
VTAVDSLGIHRNATPGTNIIQVEARVTLLDVTDKKQTVTLGTNLRLQLRYRDIHAPSTPDEMSFLVWDPSGLLISAADWEVVQLSGMVLAGGQIMVK